MKTLILLVIIANLFVVYAMLTAPYYDEEKNIFIYDKETILQKLKKLFNGVQN